MAVLNASFFEIAGKCILRKSLFATEGNLSNIKDHLDPSELKLLDELIELQPRVSDSEKCLDQNRRLPFRASAAMISVGTWYNAEIIQ